MITVTLWSCAGPGVIARNPTVTREPHSGRVAFL